MLKRFLRTCFETARTWMQEPADIRNDPTAYSLLNSLLDKLVSEEGGAQRPNYAWGLLHGAHMAKGLGFSQISAIEFGVAGGNGLLALDRIAIAVEAVLGVKVDVYGFDTGVGLPKPVDYRDLPNLFHAGDFPMNKEALQLKLKRAQLVLGPVRETLPAFLAAKRAPVGFLSIDVDLYSSTVDALKVLDGHADSLLPRVHCYFDDILGFTYNEFTGERLAINDFNNTHSTRKISPIFGLKYFMSSQFKSASWNEQFFMAHVFDHPFYGENDGLSRMKRLDLRT